MITLICNSIGSHILYINIINANPANAAQFFNVNHEKYQIYIICYRMPRGINSSQTIYIFFMIKSNVRTLIDYSYF